jgi:hypothetical protein
MLPVAYTFKYAKWYNENSLKTKMLKTNDQFGYRNRYELYKYLSEAHGLVEEKINYVEFGVASGGSLKWWAENNKNPSSRFSGFDTFSGLPEDWGNLPKGTFSTNGTPPEINDDRLTFQIGLIQDTLLDFLPKTSFTDARNIIHLDADLYSATLFVLINILPKLKKGDILMFDEFADVMHEFRAFVDAASAYSLHLEILAAVNGGNKIAFLVNP